MNTIAISPDERVRIMREAKDALVAHLISNIEPETWISPAQAGGILNLSAVTLAKLRKPCRYEVTAGNIQYKLSEVLAYRESKKL